MVNGENSTVFTAHLDWRNCNAISHLRQLPIQVVARRSRLLVSKGSPCGWADKTIKSMDASQSKASAKGWGTSHANASGYRFISPLFFSPLPTALRGERGPKPPSDFQSHSRSAASLYPNRSSENLRELSRGSALLASKLNRFWSAHWLSVRLAAQLPAPSSPALFHRKDG